MVSGGFGMVRRVESQFSTAGSVSLSLTANEAAELLNHLVGTVPEGERNLENALVKLVEALRTSDRCARLPEA